MTILASIPFGATVRFRHTPADHYDTGRVFGVSVSECQEHYDVETKDGRRFINLTDVKEARHDQ